MLKRYALSAVELGGQVYVVAYDLVLNTTIAELTDYSLYISSILRLSRLTVEKRMGQLLCLWSFMQHDSLKADTLSDRDLARFRDAELQRVLQRKSSCGREMAAKRTVNDKLSAAYAWLSWMLNTARIQTCYVSRPLVASGRSKDAISVPRLQGQPTVSFRRVGANTRHSIGFAVTGEACDEVAELFFSSTSSAFIAHRNSLILAIADAVGFRRASIMSLVTSQFNRVKLECESASFVLIRPSVQKFRYESEFAFPVWLALRVCDYCDFYRNPHVTLKKAKVSDTKDRIFLSSRDAKPLTERAVTQIFSRVMRAVGAPKGVALHTLRAKFANDQIEQELEVRLLRGMDTSASAIATSVALKMGHHNIDSIYAYVVAAQSQNAVRDRTDAALRLDRLVRINRELLQENAVLRKGLAIQAVRISGHE